MRPTKFRRPPDFRQSLGAEISAPRPVIKKTVKEKVGQAGLLFKARTPRTSWAGRCGDSSLKGRAHQNAWLEEGEGGCEDRLRAVTASGYAPGGGGGGGAKTIKNT
jgi:hypothetical protein